MNSKDNSAVMGLDRLNALFAWWGIPKSSGNGTIETQMKRFQTFAADLQKTFGDTYSQQMRTLFASNEQLGRSLQELVRCRKPQDLIAAESKILAIFFDGISRQAKSWIELTQKVEDCCATVTRQAAGEADVQPPAARPPMPRTETARQAVEPATPRPVHPVPKETGVVK
jgi:hypothetical protein